MGDDARLEGMRPGPAVVRASAVHTADILRLLSAQLAEHEIEIAESVLWSAIQGVFEDPGRGLLFVVELDGRCVGVAYVALIWTLELGGSSAWLEELYVEPAFRNAGVGTALLRAVIAECEAVGCAALDLEIVDGHERVQSLYGRHGFVPVPRSRFIRRFASPY